MMTNRGLQFLNSSDGATIWEHARQVENYRAIQPLVVGNSVLMATSLGIGTRKLNVEQLEGSWKIIEGWNSLSMSSDH